MSAASERLYALLPAIYRLRDAELGSPLRALLDVAESERAALERDIEDLYESWFVETAPEWAIPYIGALVGNLPLVEAAHSRRSDVAKTLYYRRRKGTLPMLEELARDVTGWGAHAVEFMELLGWTQNLNHLRYEPAQDPAARHPSALDRVGTVNMRSRDALDRLDGPWDGAAHTLDLRRAPPGAWLRGRKPRARSEEGWYGTRKIGFFLWRLRDHPLEQVAARQAGAPNQHGWHFHPLGMPAPLFTRSQAERDPSRLAGEIHVPGPIRALAFKQDPAAWYGPGRSLHIRADGADVPVEHVLCKDLAAWARPPAGRVAVDVRRGRMSFAAGEEPAAVVVTCTSGFSADIGGGPYDRRASLDANLTALRARAGAQPPWSQSVAKGTPVDTLQQALAAWEAAHKPPGVIEIADNGVYGGSLSVELPDDGWLVIQAANERRPLLRLFGDLAVSAPAAGGRLVLDGVLVEGGVRLEGNVRFELAHATLVPGRALTDEGEPEQPDAASLVAEAGPLQTPEVHVRSSITGAIRLPDETRRLTLRDAIVQAFETGGVAGAAVAAAEVGAAGPPASIQRCTLFGPVSVRELELASETIFMLPVTAQRRQSGCVRYCHVPAGSQTPRRFRCQPDLALEGIADPLQQQRERARLVPAFGSTRYGQPDYAQLRLDSALEIRTGAESGAEMGAFCALLQPQREANLRTRLEEYLPFGLEAALIYVT